MKFFMYLFFVLGAIFVVSVDAFAAVENTDFLKDFLADIIGRFPLISTIIFALGGLRLFFKPLTELIRDVFEYVTYDDGVDVIDRIWDSPVYYWFSWIVDFLTSIKLPKIK